MSSKDKNKNYFLPDGYFGGATEEQINQAKDLIYKKYGLTRKQAESISLEAPEYLKAVKAIPKKKSDFLNDFVSGGGILINKQAKGLFGPDAKTNNVVKRQVIQIAQRMGEPYKDLAKNPNAFNLAYTQDPTTKEFYLLVQNPDPSKSAAPIPLTSNEVMNMGLSPLTSTDPELKRISANWDAGRNTGNPKDGGMTFKNGFDIGVVEDPNINGGQPTYLKYHVENKSTGYYITLFGKDQKTGEEFRVKQLPGQKDWGSAKQRNKDQVSQNYSIDPTIENNTNRNMIDDITNENDNSEQSEQ